MSGFSRITSFSYNLMHCPELSIRYGNTPETEREANPDSEFLLKLGASLRSFDEAVSYPPHQAFIGALDPLDLPARPWSGADYNASAGVGTSGPSGAFGDILKEAATLGLLKFSDTFDLVLLESTFSAKAREALLELDIIEESDLSKFGDGFSTDQVEAALGEGALPFFYEGRLAGCVKSAHPDDPNLKAHVILENLAAKAGAVYSVKKLLKLSGADPAGIDYIIETSEEACGDANQRGGGNFAKAVGELAGLVNATGSDTRSFCAGPVHGILQAASLIKAGTFSRVIVTAGGATAKLAMNSKKHLEKGYPLLEDCLGAYALLIESADATGAGSGDIIIRNDVIGVHRIGSGSSPQHVIQNLVADPLEKSGLRFDDIDYYAPELHNPEITEAGGAGNVTLANLKMIAAMAVMKQQLERTDINSFIEKHGSAGWAPTQGHIPSGIPALGWISKWFESGRISRALVIGKGSLFLGRMTGLFDGVSILIETGNTAASGTAEKDIAVKAEAEPAKAAAAERRDGVVRVGLTVPGSESGAEELLAGASEAQSAMPGLEVVTFGDAGSDPAEAHRAMEASLKDGSIDSAVTFHYPFPVGTATVGLVTAPGSGKDMFIASTTGISDTVKADSLIKNAVAGIAAAKAMGNSSPSVGILNLEGARAALLGLKKLKSNDYPINLVPSARGDELLRGNDLVAGTADVVVCDTLSGNVFMKMFAGMASGGMTEVSGRGYGPGLGADLPPVNIISRASSAAVVAGAITYSAAAAVAGVNRIYADEIIAAEKAGLASILSAGGADKSAESGNKSSGPEPKTVDHEIEGIDVLELENAVKILKTGGIYCEAGMGCTGPVVMTSSEDREAAVKLLAKNGFIEEA